MSDSSDFQPGPAIEWFDERHFAEDVGLLFEVFGTNRMAGRVWGLMVISEDDLSAADIEERLQASAGSVSTATRQLVGLGLLERVRRPGERRTYFRPRRGGMSHLVIQRQMVISQARRLAERGLDEFGDRPGVRERLEEWRDLYEFWEGQIPEMIEKYERQRRRNQTGTE